MLASLLLSSHVKYGFQEPRKVVLFLACLLKYFYLLTCLHTAEVEDNRDPSSLLHVFILGTIESYFRQGLSG